MKKEILLFLLIISSFCWAQNIKLLNSYGNELKFDLSKYKDVQLRPNQNSKVALAAALSGGGYRASFFALGIMLELEKFKCKDDTINTTFNLLKEVDYFSTVSGGGFPVAYYLGIMYRRNTQSFRIRDIMTIAPNTNLSITQGIYSTGGKSIVREIREYGKYNSTNNFLNFTFESDPLSNSELSKHKSDLYIKPELNPTYHFAPDIFDSKARNILKSIFFKHNDLNRINITKYFCYGRHINLSTLFVSKDSNENVLYPMVFSNATIVNAILPFRFTPDILFKLRVKTKEANYLEFAIATSATFPILFKNQKLKCKFENNPDTNYINLIDGGVYDNSGVKTANEVLKMDKSSYKYLISIDARGEEVKDIYCGKDDNLKLLDILDFTTDQQYSVYAELLKSDGFNYIQFGFRSLLTETDLSALCIIDKRETFKSISKKLLQLYYSYNNDTKIDHLLEEYNRNDLSPEYKFSKQNLCYLYQICTNIKTDLALEDWERQILILAGKIVVKRKTKEIIKEFPVLFNN